MSRDEIMVKVLKRFISVMSILTVFVFVMLINKKSYALFHKRIETDIMIHIQTADEMPSQIATDVVKDTLDDEDSGLVGITSNNEPTTDKNADVREYRYVGTKVNNYAYFNCQEDIAQSADTCEVWRIIGIFKSGSDNVIKIVKNEPLKGSVFPTEYTYNAISYRLHASGDYAYWNWATSGSYNNSWATAGLQYWLNSKSLDGTGYLENLSEDAKAMIFENTYYLGNITYNSTNYVGDNTKNAYANERKGSTWDGKVGLLYPSDIGFSAESTYWDTILGYNSFNGTPSSTSWLQEANHKTFEWLISPSDNNNKRVIYWNNAGHLRDNDITNASISVRPTLYLNPEVIIKSGKGTLENPYIFDTPSETQIKLSETESGLLVNNNLKFTVTSNVSGTFNINSENQDIATITYEPSSGTKTTVTVKGIKVGETKINVNFKPSNDSYHEVTSTYTVHVGNVATTTIKSTIGKTGGVIGVSKSNTQLTSESSDIREYRYSGSDVNNYIYFNCKEGTTYETANSNCEKWRIVGVFKDENNNEHLKLVRNEILSANMMPNTYTYLTSDSMTIFKIKNGTSSNAFYNTTDDGISNNDWATAGLQYWLNSKGTGHVGYLKSLSDSSQNMIAETKYYLGIVTVDSSLNIIDTPKGAYVYERAVSECDGGKGPSTNKGTYLTFSETPNCRVWANNQATWTGKIALMYPSDYGFSTESSNWGTQLKGFSSIKLSSWMNSMPSNEGWLLSPSSYGSQDVAIWSDDGRVFGNGVNFTRAVRPSLNLKSNAIISEGDGSSLKPYFVNSGQ